MYRSVAKIKTRYSSQICVSLFRGHTIHCNIPILWCSTKVTFLNTAFMSGYFTKVLYLKFAGFFWVFYVDSNITCRLFFIPVLILKIIFSYFLKLRYY